MSILKQEVILTVYDENDRVVLDATGLRVDFDVRMISGFNRGKFDIYNLNDETVKKIMTGERFVTVKTRLHGRNEFTVANKFYVSNAYNEVKLPENIVSLFCYDKLKRSLMDKVLPEEGVTIEGKTSLKQIVARIFTAAEYKEKPEYVYFPSNVEDQDPPSTVSVFQGTVGACLEELSDQFKFRTYLKDGRVKLVFFPDEAELKFTNLEEAVPIVLRTDMMVSNPLIGPAILNVTSNLDGRLEPGNVVDISKLLTVGLTGVGDEVEVADGFFESGIAGFSKYTVLTTQHKGSNYTSDWFTSITASAPTKGTVLSTFNWFN